MVLSKLHWRLQVGSYLSSVGMCVGLVCSALVVRELGSYRRLGWILEGYCEIPVPLSLLRLCGLFSECWALTTEPKQLGHLIMDRDLQNPNNLLTYEFIVSVDFHSNLLICWGKHSSTRAQYSRPHGPLLAQSTAFFLFVCFLKHVTRPRIKWGRNDIG